MWLPKRRGMEETKTQASFARSMITSKPNFISYPRVLLNPPMKEKKKKKTRYGEGLSSSVAPAKPAKS